MRNLLLALLALVVVHSTAYAQNTAWAEKLFQGITSHDFGTCPRGAKLKHRFHLKNIYAVPLQITSIRSVCRCLTAEASTMNLKPQEEAYIDVVMDASLFQGPKNITVYVTVGPEFVSTAALSVSANARSDVVFNPGEVHFGVVQAGETPTRAIDVEYAGSLDWRIVEVVKNKSASFDVTVRETYRNSPRLLRTTGKAGYQMLVTLKPDAKPGPFQQDIILKTNDPASPILTVMVEGTIQAALSARPSEVSVGALKLGQKATQRVVVRGNQPFRIVGIDGLGNGIQADIPANPAALHVITLTCQPTTTGSLQRQLRIRTDLSGGASVTVDIQGAVAK